MTRPVEEGSLRLVRQFVNTRDLEAGTDALATPQELENWLRHNDLLSADGPVSAADLDRTVELREAIRALLGGSAGPARVLNAAARRGRLRPEFNGTARLVPEAGGVDRALGRLLVVIFEAMTDGRWRRLKLCQNPACRWVFYDASRASAGKWCSMAVCGNRNKAAAWRSRQRERASAG